MNRSVYCHVILMEQNLSVGKGGGLWQYIHTSSLGTTTSIVECFGLLNK